MSDRRELSLRLNDVLEIVGVTDEMRRLHQRTAITNEILLHVHVKRDTGEHVNWYQCGSSWEGTLTPDLASDLDMIGFPGELLVVPHRPMAGPGVFLDIIREQWTRPGYAKLQFIQDGQSLTIYHVEADDEVGFDGEGRACRKHITEGNMQGPAVTYVSKNGTHSGDKVPAYQCKGIPLFATEWITRPRHFEWPSQHLIDELKILGCLFVGVGHYESRDKELEWRLSFSLQERVMMKSLKITQHRVYVLLKMIKKYILEKSIKEESLSSYHCKTCVFYMAETTPASMWIPENIIDCLLQCLTLLLRWIKERFCPSFFLKESNLFDKEGFMAFAEPLESVVSSLLQSGHQFLYLLESDNVGEMLRAGDVLLYKPVTEARIDRYFFDTGVYPKTYIVNTFRRMNRHYDADQDSLLSYQNELEELQHRVSFQDYTEEESRTVLCYALPWLHLSIGLEFAARAVTCPERHEAEELMQNALCHMDQARNTDLVNIGLAKVTILFRLEKLEECPILLQELENCWTEPVISLCPCTPSSTVIYLDDQQYSDLASKFRKMLHVEQLRKYYVTCVIFERPQVELIPPALRYEMYRSLYTRPGSRDELNNVWFDRAVVDAKVYLYLLQYMVYSKLHLERNKQIAMDNLSNLAIHDIHNVLCHRETAFNLLGWVYLQEHRVADAVWCFLQSWKIRPHHNAAKFHVLDMIIRLAEAQRRQHDVPI